MDAFAVFRAVGFSAVSSHMIADWYESSQIPEVWVVAWLRKRGAH